MRTTVDLESDVYNFARSYADGKGISLSTAIAELIRNADGWVTPGRLVRNEYGFLEIAAAGQPITAEMVARYSEDEISL